MSLKKLLEQEVQDYDNLMSNMNKLNFKSPEEFDVYCREHINEVDYTNLPEDQGKQLNVLSEDHEVHAVGIVLRNSILSARASGNYNLTNNLKEIAVNTSALFKTMLKKLED